MDTVYRNYIVSLLCVVDAVQNIEEYQQLLAEFDRPNISNYFDTIEITVLGAFHSKEYVEFDNVCPSGS